MHGTYACANTFTCTPKSTATIPAHWIKLTYWKHVHMCMHIRIYTHAWYIVYNTYTLYTVNMWWQIHIQLQNARTYSQACHVDVNLPVHRHSHVLKKNIQRQINMHAITFAIRNQVWNPDSEIKFWIGNKNAGLVALESNKLSERLVWAANANMNRSLSHLIFRGKQCAKHRHGSGYPSEIILAILLSNSFKWLIIHAANACWRRVKRC